MLDAAAEWLIALFMAFVTVVALFLIVGIFYGGGRGISVLAASLSPKKRKARQELRQRGLKFDKRTFVSRVLMGDTPAVEAFLRAGMSPYTVDDSNVSVLHHAVVRRQSEILKLLLEAGVSPDMPANGMPMLILVQPGDTKTAQVLLDHGASVDIRTELEGRTPLMLACSRGDTALARVLIEAGASVHLKDRNLQTPLSEAAFSGSVEVVRLLIQHGADPNQPGTASTALGSAAFKGYVEVMRELLAAGARVNEKNSDGETALIQAASQGHAEVIDLLIRAGADIHIRNYGKTALGFAVQRKHAAAAERLRKAGAIE